jgi:hypothetical protein
VKNYALILGMALFAGCSGPGAPKEKTADSVSRDTLVQSSPSPPPDTTHRRLVGRDSSITGDSMRKEQANSSEPTLQEIYQQYIAKYTAPCVIDSSFKLGVGRYRLRIEHMCTFDCGIIVPGSYVHMYKLDSFITHDFVTHITLQKNGKKILQRTLTKKDFWLKDSPELFSYAALFCPNLELQKGLEMIILNYSISIPLTDVGIAATASIDEKGGMHFKVGY